ncbi:MAG: glycosyltransferase family 4 protein [Chlorobiaceae bacterium]|nr:glycosyltransferase family 4 protein [Chlorobiaceae bacterium]
MFTHKHKILITANTTWNLVNFRSGLISTLIESGFDVIAVAPEDGYCERLERIGCRYVHLAMDNQGTHPVRDFQLILGFLKIIFRERPHAVLAYTVKPNVYASLAAQIVGVPVINNISGLGTAFIRGGWMANLVSLLYRVGLNRSKCVFFQNDDDRTLFLKNGLVKRAKTDLLPGSGIDLEHYDAMKFAVVDHTGDGLVFLMVARLLWDKGVREYVDAARIVKKQNPKMRFQILGFLDVRNQTAVPREDLEAWVQEGIIDYLGTSDDVRSFLADADCVVLPSYREGTPRSLLEAAAMAKPLISTDVPGCREVVKEGVNGYLCEVRNSNDLAEKMLKFAALPTDLRLKMGCQSRSIAETCFDEQIVINKYLQAIQKTGIKLTRLFSS